jgi:hypothetical protein
VVVSKRTVKTITSRTGVQIEKIYCRMCRENKKPSDFYVATDTTLDTNGFMSVCKSCCESIYQGTYRAEKNTARALLITCRILNWKFDEDTVNAALLHIETAKKNGAVPQGVVGFYKGKLGLSSGKSFTERENNSLTFTEVSGLKIEPEDPLGNHVTEKTTEELEKIWGDSLEYEDYIWLESEYAIWEGDYNIRSRGEVNLLRLIILKLFDIRKGRSSKQNVNKLEEDFQKLLVTSNLSPAQSNAASKGNIADTWGMLIKRIEEETPAEYYKDYKLFDDFFDLKKYLKNYVSRPISNFLNGRKNYSVDDIDIPLEDGMFGSESSGEIESSKNVDEDKPESE